jgi:hypothetical protein
MNTVDRAFNQQHICLFYGSEKDLVDTAVPYFKEGLRKNEFCVWVVGGWLSVENAQAFLERGIEDFGSYLRNGQVEILDYKEWYLKSGKFDRQEILKAWKNKEEQALGLGFSGLRASGNTSFLKEIKWEDLIDYEREVNEQIPKTKIEALCTYPLNELDLSELFLLSMHHRFAFSVKNGHSHLIKNVKLENLKSNIKYYLGS